MHSHTRHNTLQKQSSTTNWCHYVQYLISNWIRLGGCCEAPRASAAFECSGNLQKLPTSKANCPDNNVKHQPALVIPFLRAELQVLIKQETNLLRPTCNWMFKWFSPDLTFTYPTSSFRKVYAIGECVLLATGRRMESGVITLSKNAECRK